MNGKKIFLIAGARTAIGAFGRSLKDVTVDKLAEHVIVHALERAGVNPGQVDGCILGHAFQSGMTPNTARFAWLNAGLPASATAYTIQNQCGSGLKAITAAMKDIACGQGDIFVAGGAESMSTVPYMYNGSLRFNSWLAKKLPKFFPKMGPRLTLGLLQDGMAPMHLLKDTRTVAMMQTAQRLADNFGITREAMDEFALRSQTLAKAAIDSGRFAREIVPFLTKRGVFSTDEHPRPTTREGLAALKPAMKSRSITAGNSSGINDGACAVVVASAAKTAEFGLKPMVELVDYVLVGLDPEQMGLGPYYAVQKLLQRNNLTVPDIDLFEVNEAFAAQYLADELLLGLDRNKVNRNGGALALGHPIAMSGARVTYSLAHEMVASGAEFGVATLCIGGGMGIAILCKNAS